MISPRNDKLPVNEKRKKLKTVIISDDAFFVKYYYFSKKTTPTNSCKMHNQMSTKCLFAPLINTNSDNNCKMCTFSVEHSFDKEIISINISSNISDLSRKKLAIYSSNYTVLFGITFIQFLSIYQVENTYVIL